MAVRRMLHALGYRYVLHDRRLPGKPDLVFPARRKVLFVHGCFWHGHDCSRGFRPTTNAVHWAEKIEGNRVRDVRSTLVLQTLGWQVGTVWECELRRDRVDALRHRLVAFLA
jgi:DNA mismatch endonuclease (patch repair protein)